jgi:hypothetical protein
MMPRRKRLTPETMMAAVKVNDDGCWIYQKSLNNRGYGPHRTYYERLKGPIPADLTLDHYRLNVGPRKAPCSRACVNPDHLEPVPLKVNILRSDSVSAKHARRTHCPNGHEFAGDNLTVCSRDGSRECRRCNADWQKHHRDSRTDEERRANRAYMREWVLRNRKTAVLVRDDSGHVIGSAILVDEADAPVLGGPPLPWRAGAQAWSDGVRIRPRVYALDGSEIGRMYLIEGPA